MDEKRAGLVPSSGVPPELFTMNAPMDTESTELVDLRRDTLEAQVRERTAELEYAITDLQREVERRQQAESALKGK